jgi:hypothetical protein
VLTNEEETPFDAETFESLLENTTGKGLEHLALNIKLMVTYVPVSREQRLGHDPLQTGRKLHCQNIWRMDRLLMAFPNGSPPGLGNPMTQVGFLTWLGVTLDSDPNASLRTNDPVDDRELV